jgi:3-phenylpropionate/trans-cinnamate dioxygenase ferredoxin subunit
MDNQEEFVSVMDEKELQEGKMKLVAFEGIPLLFIKQLGKIFVIDNRCPHMACGFVGGSLDGLVIVCPCHDWRFSLETGEYEVDPSMKLVMFQWKVELGKIWVKLDEE